MTASRDLWCLWLDCGCALSPCDLCLFELGHPGAVPRYQLNCLPTWIEQKTKVGKCILIFSLPLLRWLQWKIHLLPDHIIIITSGIYDVIASPWDFSFIWRHWNAYESTDYQLEQWLYSLAMPTRVIVVLWPLGRPAVYQRLFLLRHTQYSYVMIITVYFLFISLCIFPLFPYISFISNNISNEGTLRRPILSANSVVRLKLCITSTCNGCGDTHPEVEFVTSGSVKFLPAV